MVLPELKSRRDKIRSLMIKHHIDAALISSNVNLLYTYGQIISGYVYLPLNEPARIFVKRPNNITGEYIHQIRKPEQIPDILASAGISMPQKLMFEGDEMPYNEYTRLAAVFPEAEVVNATEILREARSVKTELEIELFTRAGIAHTNAYLKIPSVYHEGMTDNQFSIEIERIMRLEGCLGIFRIFGQSMEIFMGSILTGDNASAPSPYDFALGGAGNDSSLPIGANGTPLKAGQTVMVDYGGNFNGYISDMSRVFSIGKTSGDAYEAHQVCLDIQQAVIDAVKPGVTGEELYNIAIGIVNKSKYAQYFMGVGQKAGFIGHGIGLQINELPVLAPRQKQEFQPGMVFALEPKIVLPHIGPVGIENSWVVTSEGIRKLTNAPEDIIELK